MKQCAWLWLIALAGAGMAFGDDALRDAMQSDTAIKDASARIESLAGEMDTSNVFSSENIASNRDVALRLTAVRNNDMQAVLRMLEQSLKQPTNQAACLLGARQGHERISKTLLGLGRRLGAMSAGDNAGALEKIRALSQAADSLARDAVAPTEAQQQKADDLAREIRAATNMTANTEAVKDMKQAAEKLVEGDPKLAADEMKKAVAALEQESGMRENELAAAAARKDALENASQELNKLSKEADKLAAAPEDARTADKALDMMVKADETAKALDKAVAPDAAANTRAGQNELQNNQLSKAAQDFQAAANQAAAAADQVAAEMKASIDAQSAALSQMTEMANQMAALQDFKDRLDAVSTENKAATDHQAAAEKMDQLGKDLNNAALPEPGKDVGNAKAETDQGNNDAAQKSLAAAGQKLDTAMKQASAKMNALMAQAAGAPATPQPGTPPATPETQEPMGPPQEIGDQQGREKAFGTATPETGAVPAGSRVWKAALPPNERQSLLSGQQEKSLPIMEDDAKRYFERLAK